MIYGREALRKFREERDGGSERREATLLDHIPPDAPMDDATLTVWNGERWVTWDRWVVTAPLIVDETHTEETRRTEGAAPVAGTPSRCTNEQGRLWE